MDNITGPPVTGEDFFGRENEIAYTWDSLKTGNNLMLPSPRRVGKTSFALRLLEKAKEEGWSIVQINMEQVSTEQKFIELFVEQLKQLSWWEKTKDVGKGFLDFFKQLKLSAAHGDIKVQLDWQTSKEDVYQQLAGLLKHSENTLIFFDEVTVLLNSILKAGESGKKNVGSFLHWLRDIRIVANSRIRWIYCSSVGIENFTHRHGISDTINDLLDYKLRPYGKDLSIRMLQSLSNSKRLNLSEEVCNAIVDKIEYCLPFFLQIMFHKIHYLSTVEEEPINNEIVEKAYMTLINERHFNTWIERINEQYEDDATAAFDALRHICQIKEGVTRPNLINIVVALGLDANKADEVISRLLYMLKNDGYLIDEQDRYYFRSPLLRDFWFNRFVK